MKRDATTWIADNEKFAIVGLEVDLEETFPIRPYADDLYAFADEAFEVPAHWGEWLGSIRTEEVQSCNLFLLAKMPSKPPEVLDGENITLQRRTGRLYLGLLLAKLFSPSHRPVMLTGARYGGKVDVRQHGDFDVPLANLIQPYPALVAGNVAMAARLGQAIDAFSLADIAGGRWRFNRTLALYHEARTTIDSMERLHQYCRCIEGLIVPDDGKTRNQFKSRTETFIGPRHHDLIGEAFDIRSAVEHLHEDRYLHPFSRDIRLKLVKSEAVLEFVARTAIQRILLDQALWPHFANTVAAKAFWAMPTAERQRIWGDLVSIGDALQGFDPTYISDAELGA